MTRSPPRGFTIVELMVSVVLSGIVIAFVFQIHTQMVGALRGQANISEVGEIVTAAREMISRELRVAGIGFPPSGVRFGGGVTDIHRGVVARDDISGGADKDWVDFLEIQRGKDDALQIDLVSAGVLQWVFAHPNADTRATQRGFFVNQPFIISNDTATAACLAPVLTWDAVAFYFDETINAVGSPCEGVFSPGDKVRIQPFTTIGFRLDPARLDLGVLQRQVDGGAWEDLGIGFTNLQVAVRYFELADVTDVDGDGDPTKDWYSDAKMEPASVLRPAAGIPVQVGFSLEARNLRPLGSVASSATPGYVSVDSTLKDNNPLGNFGESGGACAGKQYDPCGVPDLTTTDFVRYMFPDRVYRSTSTTVWLRNRRNTL